VPGLRQFAISASVLSALAVGVGFFLSGDEAFDWELTAVLVGVAVGGEGLRTLIRRDRTRRRESSKI
jgi:hypothetical protein